MLVVGEFLKLGSSPHTRGAHFNNSRCWSLYRDHPRIRGEHGRLPALPAHVTGIIPAYAGSTVAAAKSTGRGLGSSPHTRGARSSIVRNVLSLRDHPRIRGEHPPQAISSRTQSGIIPAYAGSTRPRHGWAPSRRGIIPAYAGSTTPFSQSIEATWGSSPHTRGAPSMALLRPSSFGDHPRIRGEHR